MRTPGDDVELAAGFLFTEGIIAGPDELEGVEAHGAERGGGAAAPVARLDPAKLDRHSFVSSSCGACGKRSIAAVRVTASASDRCRGSLASAPRSSTACPDSLRAGQSGFARTGGIHASACSTRPAGCSGSGRTSVATTRWTS